MEGRVVHAGQLFQFRLYWMHPEMSLLRRFVIRAAQELGHNPEARAKVSQVQSHLIQ